MTKIPSGRPDWYDQVVITGSDVTLPISISSSTATLDVNIASSAVTLNVAITSSVTLNVAITSSSVTLDVNIASSAATLNVAITSSSTTLDVNITNSSLNVNATIVSSSATLDINLKSSDITLDVNIASSSATLNVAITSSTVTLDVNIASQSSALSVAITSSTATLDINLKSSDITLDVNIASSATTLNVVITSSSVTLDVNIASSAATLNVNISSSSTTLNVAVQGTADINIASADIYLNVQNANYVEQRELKSNNASTVAGWASAGLQGKFFPQGMMGYIKTVSVYVKNTTTSDTTIKVYMAIEPGLPAIYENTITVPASSEGWQTVYVSAFWHYASMFVYWENTGGVAQIAYDTSSAKDAYYYNSTYGKWIYENRAYWFMVDMYAQAKGVLPVSGTINTIHIPNVSSGAVNNSVTVSATSATKIISAEGTGKTTYIHLISYDDFVMWKIYVDGQLITLFNTDRTISADYLYNSYSQTAPVTGVGINLTRYDTSNEVYAIVITVPIEFKQKIEIYAQAITASSATVSANMMYNLIS